MQNYLLKPFGSEDLGNKIFESPYGILRDLLARHKISLNTYDQGNLGSAERVLFFNHDPEFYKKCIDSGLTKDNLILLAFEPKVVIPDQYEEKVWNQFSKVFTHQDDLIDNQRVFKLRYPMGKPSSHKVTPVGDRQFITLINANKYSLVKGELYSYRRRAIRYFEKFPGFDLYGHDWDKGSRAFDINNLPKSTILKHPVEVAETFLDRRPYRCYRGSIVDKYETLENYKFCLCFENEASPGYITEKIFDCFITGTIPVYFGAPNIRDYIPDKCFIDMKKYSSFEELRNYLLHLPVTKSTSLQRNGQGFLHSPSFEVWKPAGAFQEIISGLLA